MLLNLERARERLTRNEVDSSRIINSCMALVWITWNSPGKAGRLEESRSRPACSSIRNLKCAN